MSNLPVFRLDAFSSNSLRETLRLLRRAQTILDAPERWTQHEWARTADGRPVSPDEAAASRFCIAGAVFAAEAELFGTELGFDIGSTEEAAVSEGRLVVPKRIWTALTLLALPMLYLYAYLYADELATTDEAHRQADPRADKSEDVIRWWEKAPLVAAWVNDYQRVEWAHVAAALAATIDLTADELRLRRQRKRKTQGGQS